jgi:hypothetical protein
VLWSSDREQFAVPLIQNIGVAEREQFPVPPIQNLGVADREQFPVPLIQNPSAADPDYFGKLVPDPNPHLSESRNRIRSIKVKRWKP